MSIILLSALFGAFSSAQDPNACAYKQWPIWAGGSGDEKMKAMGFDPTNNYIIAGGTSQSADFAPAQNQHGFLFAMDLNANWIWGNFFYNVSYAVS